MPDSLLDVRPLPMPEARRFWDDKVVLPPREFYRLAEAQRVNAFTVSGVADMDALREIWSSLGEAREAGRSFASWASDVPEALREFSKRRLETIWRTNMQTAFNVGRYAQMTANASDLPWWMYDAVNDSRTRPTHRALDGLVFRHDDPFWDTWYPPNGHRCRCSVRALSDTDLKARGLTPEDYDPTGELIAIRDLDGSPLPERPLWPDPGFESNPGRAHYKPDLDKYPAHLRQAFLERLLDRACPDDWAAFADSPCFVRLKRNLKQEDLEALQALVWARGRGGVEGYPEWVDKILGDGVPRGEFHALFNLPAFLLRRVSAQPRLQLAVMDDTQLLHLHFDKAPGAALTRDEIKRIPRMLLAGEWYADQEDPALLLAWQRMEGADDRWLKVVLRLDRYIPKTRAVANIVTTSGVVGKWDLKEGRYKRIL